MQQITAQKFLNEIAENKLQLDVCDINPESETVVKLQQSLQKLKKVSSSISEVFFGNLIKNTSDLPVAIKIFLDYTNQEKACDKISVSVNNIYMMSGLKYEINVYKYIQEHIIAPNLSPNFVSYVASGRCCWEKIEKMFTSAERESIKENLGNNEDISILRDGGSLPPNPALNILITERPGVTWFGEEMSIEKLSDRTLPKIDQNKILLQIIFSLAVMQKFGIVHNDLHTENILLVTLPIPFQLGFTIENRNYLIATKYIPYIYDWDFAYCKHLGSNPKIEQYKYANYRNDFYPEDSFDPRRDLYTLLCYLGFDRTVIYDTHIARYKENTAKLEMRDKYIIQTTKEQMEKIKNIGILLETTEDVYKILGTDLIEILGREEKFATADADLLLIKTYSGQVTSGRVSPWEITLYNPHSCRITAVDKNFPTPKAVLEGNYFEEFSIETLDFLDSNFVYTL